jgi:hypothetical protein
LKAIEVAHHGWWGQKAVHFYMRKQNDAVQQFTALRSALLREREKLQARLREIDEALGNAGGGGPRRGRVLGARPENAMNIREAVAKVTAKKPLSIREIVAEVQKIGSKVPTRSILWARIFTVRARRNSSAPMASSRPCHDVISCAVVGP